MKYHERGRHDPVDAYMAGFCIWISPRQILINEKALKAYTPEPGVETEAYEDMLSQIEHEAEIKRLKYFGVQEHPAPAPERR